MNINVVNFLISSVTGVGASFLVWWITFKLLVPKLRFSENISESETEENPSGFRYRFKFENTGCRNIIDIEIIVKLRIRGLDNKRPQNWEVIYLPTSTLDYKKVSIVRPASKGGLRMLLEIKTYACDYFQNNMFSSFIIERSKNKMITLEDVMALGTESELQVMAIGTDEFSGAKKFFNSNIFHRQSIVSGLFDRNSLRIL